MGEERGGRGEELPFRGQEYGGIEREAEMFGKGRRQVNRANLVAVALPDVTSLTAF